MPAPLRAMRPGNDIDLPKLVPTVTKCAIFRFQAPTSVKTLLATLAFLAACLFAPTAAATDSATNHLARTAGGIATGAFATIIADRMEVRERGWAGFFASSAIGIGVAAAQKGGSGNGQTSSFGSNLVAHIVGSAIGAFVTDGFLLRPVVSRDFAGRNVVGVYAALNF